MDFDSEFDRATSAFPDITDDFDPTQLASVKSTSAAPPPAAVDDFGWGFESAPSAPPAAVKVTGDADDEVEKFENQFPELDDTPAFQPVAAPTQPTLRSAFIATPAPSAPAISPGPPLYTQADDEEEPEVIKEWREKQAAQIKEREDKAARRKADTVKKAEESIDQFYEDYNKQKEKNIRENKENEAKYVDDLTAALSEGTTWSRICSLIDLENSQSKTLARAGPGTTDLSRYREVLMRLRREGERAPGAAGY
ncbi:hypothetical protein CALVIDRAFT_485126 [Calocera viscosa TUFC12733]|uniref:Clathrin light chain n=1 Tax=Calocera viscosa (strain TUFC12733) TaxID=1330018 RepID=A0A167JUB3_CALVF|nr:hypothetical protein CALVIDRAFT_485126 [Calocera viscosa TUFC12733]